MKIVYKREIDMDWQSDQGDFYAVCIMDVWTVSFVSS
jgi:hypothetical protein